MWLAGSSDGQLWWIFIFIGAIAAFGLAETIHTEIAWRLTRATREAFETGSYRDDPDFKRAVSERSWLARAFALPWDCPRCGSPVRRFFEQVSDYTKTPQYDSIHRWQFVHYCEPCRVYGVDLRREWTTGGPPTGS